jgi:putative solute:sodium symporter small subunit
LTIAPETVDQRRAYWRYNLALTLGLLCLWVIVTFVPIYWARDLNHISLFGWPLAFYMGAQGALITYLLIVWVYAQGMDRLDRRFGVAEGGVVDGNDAGKDLGKDLGNKLSKTGDA